VTVCFSTVSSFLAGFFFSLSLPSLTFFITYYGGTYLTDLILRLAQVVGGMRLPYQAEHAINFFSDGIWELRQDESQEEVEVAYASVMRPLQTQLSDVEYTELLNDLWNTSATFAPADWEDRISYGIHEIIWSTGVTSVVHGPAQAAGTTSEILVALLSPLPSRPRRLHVLHWSTGLRGRVMDPVQGTRRKEQWSPHDVLDLALMLELLRLPMRLLPLLSLLLLLMMLPPWSVPAKLLPLLLQVILLLRQTLIVLLWYPPRSNLRMMYFPSINLHMVYILDPDPIQGTAVVLR
jgi:hypothetical protein